MTSMSAPLEPIRPRQSMNARVTNGCSCCLGHLRCRWVFPHRSCTHRRTCNHRETRAQRRQSRPTRIMCREHNRSLQSANFLERFFRLRGDRTGRAGENLLRSPPPSFIRATIERSLKYLITDTEPGSTSIRWK